MKNLILVTLLPLMTTVLFTACGPIDPPSAMEGEVAITPEWPERAPVPAKYTILIGDVPAELSGTGKQDFPQKIEEGKYDVNAYNSPDGFTVEGLTAIVNTDGNCMKATPGWLFAWKGEVNIMANESAGVSAKMGNMMKRLNIALSIVDGDTDEITAASGSLSGIAGSVYLPDGTLAQSSEVSFALQESFRHYNSAIGLLGTLGEANNLSVSITYAGADLTAGLDISGDIAGFNDDRDVAMDIALEVSGLASGNPVLTVIEVTESQTNYDYSDLPSQETHMIIKPEGDNAPEIKFIRLTDNGGAVYTSAVNNNRTTEMTELPATVEKVETAPTDGNYSEATIHLAEYDATRATISLDFDTFHLRKPADMLLVSANLGKEFVMMNDIDLDGSTSNLWAPIGASETAPFTGTFDGNGFGITGLYLGNNNNSGLFGYNNGTVRNVNVKGGELKMNTARYGGVISARNLENGLIDNCTNSIDIEVYSTGAGIIGHNRGTVSNCTNTGKVASCYQHCAGIVGQNIGGNIISCTNKGDIIPSVKNAGKNIGTSQAGIAGFNNSGLISKCRNEGAIEGFVSGGIVGNNINGNIEECVNTGTVTGDSTMLGSLGGIAGWHDGGIISKCVNEATATVTNTASLTGGIAGQVSMIDGVVTEINLSVNKASISGRGHIGGIIGQMEGKSETLLAAVYGCSNSGVISSTYYNAGGIVGICSNYTTITGCKNSGNITNTNNFAGGITAENFGVITACYNAGDISGARYVGGIVGDHGDGKGTVKASYATGTVAGLISGTLIGNNTNGTVEYCFWANSDSPVGNGSSAGITKFSASAGGWPANEPVNNWGVGTIGKNGLFWKSLGTASTSVYPTLWWE